MISISSVLIKLAVGSESQNKFTELISKYWNSWVKNMGKMEEEIDKLQDPIVQKLFENFKSHLPTDKDIQDAKIDALKSFQK